MGNLARKEPPREEIIAGKTVLMSPRSVEVYLNRGGFFEIDETYAVYSEADLSVMNDEDLAAALKSARMAYRKEKHNPQVWHLLADIYAQMGEWYWAGYWHGVLLANGQSDLKASDLQKAGPSFFEGMGYGVVTSQGAPYYTKFSWDGSVLSAQKSVNLGGMLPDETTGVPGYWVGIYNPWNLTNVRGKLAETYRKGAFDPRDYGDMIFDFMRADLVQDVTLEPDDGDRYVVPVAGTDSWQSVYLTSEGIERGRLLLGKYETSFLRVDKPVRIESDQPFRMGKPIQLAHALHRRKIVLNILTDGLAWNEQKKEHGENIPNILKFFSKGVIFDEAYCGSEYTYPSLATIETGLLPTTSQLFGSKGATRLGPDQTTLSEQMQTLGYYCVNVMGSAEGIYNGATRGYDRLIINHIALPAYEGVERLIDQLEAFEETDQFLFLHVTDSHPYNADVKTRESMQTHVPLQDIVDIDMSTSVFLQATRSNQEQNRRCIRDMDRQLGILFDYLESHYSDDEILVSLYSDHGCSIYSEQPWLLSKMHSNSTLMVRGGGVPKGVRAQELVSTADIYAIIGHYAGFDLPEITDANLPEVFGGKRREMTISQSVFIGQTRKICLRTEQYACRFETENNTEPDGSVMAVPYSLHVYRRPDEKEEVDDETVRQMFHRYLVEHAEIFKLKGNMESA